MSAAAFPPETLGRARGVGACPPGAPALVAMTRVPTLGALARKLRMAGGLT